MNYIIIPFISYNLEDTKIGEMLHDYIISRIDRFPIDDFIFVGSHMSWKKEKITVKNKNIQYIPTQHSHQENLEMAIDLINDDDNFIIMDSDLMIYDYNIFNEILEQLNYHDIVSNIDSGCRITPTYFHIWQKEQGFEDDPYRNYAYNLPILAPSEFRGGRGRFAATLFGCRKSFWKQHSEHNLEGQYESMEMFARTIIEKTPLVRAKELLDYRFNLWIEPTSKEIVKTINSDDTRCTEEATINAPYYHIRNFGECPKIIRYYQLYDKWDMGSPQETQRLLAWFIVVLEKVKETNKDFPDYNHYIDRIISETGISKEQFNSYIQQFKEFHRTQLL